MEPDAKSDRMLRWISGDPLSAADRESLLADLQGNPQERVAVLADDAMESLLRGLSSLPRTKDDFVRKTMGRIAQAELRSGKVEVGASAAPLQIGLRRGWTLMAARARRKTALAGGMAVAVVLGLALWLLRLSNNARQETGESAIAARQPPVPVSNIDANHSASKSAALATLLKTDRAEWDSPRRDGDTFGRGRAVLLRGTAELEFDKGTLVSMTGPAVFDLRKPQEVFVERGRLAVHVPAQAVGFTAVTPVGRVVDLGTDFDVNVADSGHTEAVVRRGKIRISPQRQGEKAAKAVELTAGGLDRASISLPDVDAPLLPVSTVFGDGHGRFMGMISVNGKTVEFDSPNEFRDFQSSVMKQLRDSPQQFSQQWSMSVTSSGSSSAFGMGRSQRQAACGAIVRRRRPQVGTRRHRRHGGPPVRSRCPAVASPAARTVPPGECGQPGHAGNAGQNA